MAGIYPMANGIPLDGSGNTTSAFSAFRPTSLAGLKSSFTYNPAGSIDGAPIMHRTPKPTSGVIADKTSGVGAPYLTRKPLGVGEGIKALLKLPMMLFGKVDTFYTLGASPPDTVPAAVTFGSVRQFYGQDGHGYMLNAPANNNAIVGVFTR